MTPQLSAFLDILGPDYQTQGWTEDPLPLVSLETFLDGNDDEGSIQNQDFGAAVAALKALSSHPDVEHLLLGITQWEGEGAWPVAEYIYLMTSADPADLAAALEEQGLFVSEHGTAEDAHQPHDAKAAFDQPDGMRLVWFWMD